MPGLLKTQNSNIETPTRDEIKQAIDALKATIAIKAKPVTDVMDKQNFDDNSSMIASTVLHPITAGKKLAEWAKKAQLTAAGVPTVSDEASMYAYAPSEDEQVKAGIDLAGLMQTGAIPFAPKSSGGTLGTMAGINAKNAPVDKFTEAEKIAKSLELFKNKVGSPEWIAANRDIHGKTGIHYGADNMPRFEIDDSNFKFNPQKIDSWGIGSGNDQSFNARHKEAIDLEKEGLPANKIFKLTDMIKRGDSWEDLRPQNIKEQAAIHPELSRNYENHNLLFRSMDSLGDMGFRGNYDPGFNSLLKTDGLSGRIDYSMESKNPKSVAIHELQHAIQHHEGFAGGGSPDQFKHQYDKDLATLHAYNSVQNDVNDALDLAIASGDEKRVNDKIETLDVIRKKIDDIKKKIAIRPEESYKRLAGEAEARAVEKRMNMSPEQRAANFPLDSYDVPISDLIVRKK